MRKKDRVWHKTITVALLIGIIIIVFSSCHIKRQMDQLNAMEGIDVYELEDKTSVNTKPIDQNEHIWEWCEDLTLLQEQYPKIEKGFFEYYTEERWNQTITQLIRDIGNVYMTDEMIAYRIQAVLAMLCDTNAEFASGYSSKYREEQVYYPIMVQKFADGKYYITRILAENKECLGGQLVAIDGVNMASVVEKLKTIIPSETIQIVNQMIQEKYISYQDMNYLQICQSETATFQIQLEDEVEKVITLEPKTLEQLDVNRIARAKDYFEETAFTSGEYDLGCDSYCSSYDTGHHVLYLSYSNQGNLENQFKRFIESTMKLMKEKEELDKKLVIDLRNTTNDKTEWIQKYLINNNKEYLQGIQIDVMVGSGTTYSGVKIVNQLMESFNIRIFGEETGGAVNGRTESMELYLPKTGSVVNYSIEESNNTKLNSRILQSDIKQGIIPDYIIYPTIEEYMAGKDSLYEYVATMQ